MSLDAIAIAVPTIRQDAAEIARQVGADPAFITDKVGVRERYLLGPGETGIGLAEQACRRLMAAEALDSVAIDLVVFVTQTPDRRLPQNSAGLCAALGLSSSVAAFDLALGCSGFVYGLAVVESFLTTIGGTQALLVTCDPYSRIMAAEDRSTNAVFGDAATASLIRRDGSGGRLGAMVFGTDGARGDAIAIAAGGAAAPLVSLDVPSGVADHSRDALRLQMNGRDVFNFVMTDVADSIHACLARNAVTLDDVDVFALHQGSLFMLEALAKRVGIPRDRLLVNMDRYANTVSSTVPSLLAPGLADGSLRGRTVLISGFGVGLSWATALLRF